MATSLIKLKRAREDIAEVKKFIYETEERFPAVQELYERFQDLRDESMNHSEYNFSLKNIFELHETIPRVRKLIKSEEIEKIVEAHMNLLELEKSRDNLCAEFYYFPTQNYLDEITLKDYYGDVRLLSEEFTETLWIFVRKASTYARFDAQKIIKVLQIIEYEEGLDAEAIERQEKDGFIPEGRPKCLRTRMFEILEEEVKNRILASLPHDKSNENWFALNLESLKINVFNDLRIINADYRLCFPPKYDIVSRMLKIYHECISNYLQEQVYILEIRQINSLLIWLHTYEGPDLLGHEGLKFSLSKENLPPLLSQEILEYCHQKYLEYFESQYEVCFSNTIEKEMENWNDPNKFPPSDENGYFYTEANWIVIPNIKEKVRNCRDFSLIHFLIRYFFL